MDVKRLYLNVKFKTLNGCPNRLNVMSQALNG